MKHIQSDSRKIKKGDIFIALKCEVNDGHQYIEQAIKNGATKIIAEHGNYSVETLIVSDTRKYINEYLKENYSKYINDMTIIGITGTNGKTTSAYLLYQALNKLGLKAAYIGTIGFYLDKKISNLPNTSVDICDTYNLILEAYYKGYKTVILEVSSHALENNRLETLLFDYAIFTNLTRDHLDFHKTMENYALAKQKLFKKLKPNGIAIINTDDNYKDYYLLDNNNITYGLNGDYKILNYDTNSFDILVNNKKYNFKMKLVGNYNVYNMLTVIIVLSNMNFSMEKITEVIKELQAPPGRLETINYLSNKIIIDYAHTPDAIEKVMSALNREDYNNYYVIFGCTGDRDRLKRPIMGNIVSKLADYFIITDDDPHSEDEMQIVNDIIKDSDYDNYEICLDRKEAIKKGINLLKEKDVLFILGKGHEEYIIKDSGNIKHNDKCEVLNYLEEL